VLKFLGGPVLTQGESEGRESRNRGEERRRELARWALLAVLIFFPINNSKISPSNFQVLFFYINNS